jgi:hypothetical protein
VRYEKSGTKGARYELGRGTKGAVRKERYEKSGTKRPRNVRLNEYGKRSISYSASTKWNDLPNDIKNAPSLNSFKIQLKSHFLSK